MRVLGVLRKFRSAEAGVTAIEFAVVAPVLCILIMGIIEFSIIMMVYNVMEGATATSARTGKTDYVDASGDRQQTILDTIANRAGSLIDESKLTVTTKYYKQYDQIGDPEPYVDTNHNGQYDAGEPFTDINGNGVWDADMGQSGFGSAGDIVVYTVSYPWAISTPVVSSFLGTGGIFTITTHAVVKNEPY